MSYQSSKHLFIIPIISIMSISYKTIGNNFKWPFIAAKWSEFLHFFRDFKYLYHFESLNAVLYLSVHNWTEFLVDFNMGESLGLGKKSSGPETNTETWSWFLLPIPKPNFGRRYRNQISVVHYLGESTTQGYNENSCKNVTPNWKTWLISLRYGRTQTLPSRPSAQNYPRMYDVAKQNQTSHP